MLRILQVCNVGQIVGGTAACAWTVTKSLPTFDHCVAFLRPVSAETCSAFSHCRVFQWDAVTRSRVAAVDPDLVILHNTSRCRADERLPAVTVQYLHSKITPARADLTLYCSHWLARQYGALLDDCRKTSRSCPRQGGNPQAVTQNPVCVQAVPRPTPAKTNDDTRILRETPVIGRICTPQRKKWPNALIPFYKELANRFPEAYWEFVGCPAGLVEPLRTACGHQVRFFPASWSMRGRLWHWDAMLYHNPHLTESFGRTAAEAMRAGCIPIVDDRGGFSEQVIVGSGFRCRNTDDFIDAVQRVHSPADRWHISRAGRAYADETFSLTRFGRDLLHRCREAAASDWPVGGRHRLATTSPRRGLIDWEMVFPPEMTSNEPAV